MLGVLTAEIQSLVEQDPSLVGLALTQQNLAKMGQHGAFIPSNSTARRSQYSA